MPGVRPLCARLVSFLVFVTVACLSASVAAQTKPERTDVGGATPTSILWVGNSFFYYNNSMQETAMETVQEYFGS